MAKYDSLAKDILENIGGAENIESVNHCMTRLRFYLKDDSLAKDSQLEEVDGIVAVVRSGGQYMVVIGNHVPKVYQALCKAAGIKPETAVKKEEPEQEVPHTAKEWFNFFIGIVTGVVTPFLGVMTACGIFRAMLVLFVAIGWMDGTGSTYHILHALGDSFFYFMPVMVAYTSAQKFDLPVMEGLVIGLAPLYPTMLAGSGVDISHLFGIPVIMPPAGDYARALIPAICAVGFAAWFEKKYKKYIPDEVQVFMVPLITCSVTFCLTLLVIGPITSYISVFLSVVLEDIARFSGVLLGAVIGGFWQVLVMFGLHWALIALMINNIAVDGSSALLVGFFCCSFAQCGALLAIWLRTHDDKTRELCPPALLSAIAGITEPVIYGITLPRKRPFIITCIVGAITGGALAASGCTMYNYGGIGVFGYMSFIGDDIQGMLSSILWSLVAVLLTFVLVYFTCKEEEPEKEEEDNPFSAQRLVCSPMTGQMKPLNSIDDAVFSSGMVGPGVVVEPSEGRVVAPFNGKVVTVAPTGHAVGLVSDRGEIELLIHVGIDTVRLNGEGFKALVKEDDKVKRGQPLIDFDISLIKERGYNTETPIVVTNWENYKLIQPFAMGKVEYGQELICVLEKPKMEENILGDALRNAKENQ